MSFSLYKIHFLKSSSSRAVGFCFCPFYLIKNMQYQPNAARNPNSRVSTLDFIETTDAAPQRNVTFITRPTSKYFPQTKKDRAYGFLLDKFDQYWNYLKDMTPLPVDRRFHKAFVEVYLLVTRCIYVWTFIKLIASTFLPHRMTNFATIFIVLAIYVGFAVYMIWSGCTAVESISLFLMAVCVCDPFIIDYSEHRHAVPFYQPPPVVIPISIFTTVQLMGLNFAHRHRKYLIGTVLAPAIAIYILYGMVSNSFRFPYILWSAAMLATAAVDFQMKLGHFRDGFEAKCIVYEQFISIVCLIAVNYIFMCLFSSRVRKHN